MFDITIKKLKNNQQKMNEHVLINLYSFQVLQSPFFVKIITFVEL